MPKIEDLEKLGSIAFLIGNKALPKEISQDDYNHFKSVFTDEHMANSLPAEDNDLPSIDDLDSLDLDDDNDNNDLDLPNDLGLDDNVSADTDDLGLPEDLGLDDDKASADIDDLGLPEDLGLDDDKASADIDDLGLPEDLGLDDDKVSADIDDLGLPEDLGLDDDKVSADIDDLGLPEDLDDDKVSADIDDLGLPEDLDDDKSSVDNDDLQLPEDKELEDKIAMDIKEDKNSNDIHSERLPTLGDLPLPETLPNIDDDNHNINENDEEPNIDDINIDDISDNLDDILEEDTTNLDDLDSILNGNDDILGEEETDKAEEEPISDLEDINNTEEESDKIAADDLDLDNLSLDDTADEVTEEPKDEKEEDTDKADEDIDLDDVADEDDNEEVKDEKEEETDKADDDIDLDDAAHEVTEEPKDEKEEDSNKADDDIDLDDLSLDDIADEDDNEEIKDEKEEDSNKADDDLDLDDLSLDNVADEDNNEEIKDEKEEDSNKADDDLDLDDLSLDDVADEYNNEEIKDEKEEDSNIDDDIDLDDTIDHYEEDHDDMGLDDLSLDDDLPSTNIVEGGTSLPSPELANTLPASKYEDVDKDIDHDKVINSIKYLPPITQYHVLDAILNEKLSRNSMEYLLNALERGETSENITELLNKELGLSLKEEGRKNILELIPIPNSLKDYAKIIRVAAVFLILFIAVVLFSFQFIYKPVMANKYYSQGLVSISRGAYDEAERNFAEGERYQPKQIKWYNKYARAYIARETFNEAYNKIQGALNIKPRDFETRITFGYYYRKKGEKELSQEDYILGEELYNDMLVYTDKKKEKETIYDERGLLMISRAKNMLETEYYDIAYNNYRDMVNFFGDGVVPRKRAMLIKIYQDDYNQVKAIQNHINLLKNGYIDDEVYPKLAKYLLDKDDFYGSRVLFESLLAAYPNNLESIVGYADYETRLKHYDRAREILTTTALPLYESDPFYRGKEYVYNMLGQIYYNLGEYGNAVKNFNEALAINETYPDANYNLANVYFYKEKDYAKAKEHYQMAYDNLAPTLRSDKLLYNLSWIYYSDEEYDRAFEGFNALFQKNPSNSVVSYALGNSLLHLDKANLANGFYRNALSQVLSKRDRLGRLEMRTESDFILVSYLASLYNNIGVAYAYNSTVTNTIVNEQEAFKHFVLASEYFDQVRTSNIDLERMEKRTVLVDNQNVGTATYNIMSMQGRRNLKQSTVIDDYIPKDMHYLK